MLLDWSKKCFGQLKEDIRKLGAQLALFYGTSFYAPPDDERLVIEA